MDELLVADFESKLNSLRDWPDRAIILDITKFTEIYVMYAEFLVNIIAAKIIDPMTNITFKLPLFYLMDSVMKNVGGPYAALFSRHLVQVFILAFDQISFKDKEKMRSLLVTWEERKIIPTDLLIKMRMHVDSFFQKPMGGNTAPVMNQIPMSTSIHHHIRPVVEQFQPIPQQMTRPISTNVGNTQGNSPYIRNIDDTFPRSGVNELMPMIGKRTREDVDPFRQQEYGASNIQQYPPLTQASADRYQSQDIPPLQRQRVELAAPVQQSYSQPLPRGSDRPLTSTTTPYEDRNVRDLNFGPGRGYRGTATTTQPSQSRLQHRGGGGRDRRHISRSRSRSRSGSRDRNRRGGGVPSREVRRYDRSRDGDRRVGQQGSNLPPIQENIPLSMHRGGSDQHQQSIPKRTPVSAAAVAVSDRDMISDKYNKPSSTPTTNSSTSVSNVPVAGFICEQPVLINLSRTNDILNRLKNTYTNISKTNHNTNLFELNKTKFNKNLDSVVNTLSTRLKSFIEHVNVPPKMPPALFGQMPRRPITTHSNRMKPKIEEGGGSGIRPQGSGTVHTGVSASTMTSVKTVATVQKQEIKPKVMPKFRVEDLNKNPEKVIKALYTDRPFQYSDDGLRFTTLTELAKHTDLCLARKEVTRKKESSGEKIFRAWYATTKQWISDYDSLIHPSSVSNSSHAISGGSTLTPSKSSYGHQLTSTQQQQQQSQQLQEEVFIVPADDHFTLCPVSKQAFETVWDADEGEFMFRHAAKVLITSEADSHLYDISQPTNESTVRYMIVHKLLVLDMWISQGRAETLAKAKVLYEKQNRVDRVQALVSAAGEDESEEDIFVLLEPSI